MKKDAWKIDAYALEKRSMNAGIAIEILHDPDMEALLAHLYRAAPVLWRFVSQTDNLQFFFWMVVYDKDVT